MAATAVYVNVVRVPITRGDVDQNQNFQNINATTAAFNLDGGKYCYAVKASTYGTGYAPDAPSGRDDLGNGSAPRRFSDRFCRDASYRRGWRHHH
jgi:hypothetical protein